MNEGMVFYFDYPINACLFCVEEILTTFFKKSVH